MDPNVELVLTPTCEAFDFQGSCTNVECGVPLDRRLCLAFPSLSRILFEQLKYIKSRTLCHSPNSWLVLYQTCCLILLLQPSLSISWYGLFWLLPARNLNLAFTCKRHSCFLHSKHRVWSPLSITGTQVSSLGVERPLTTFWLQYYNLKSIWCLIEDSWKLLAPRTTVNMQNTLARWTFTDPTKDYTKNTVKLTFKGYYTNLYNMFPKSN